MPHISFHLWNRPSNKTAYLIGLRKPSCPPCGCLKTAWTSAMFFTDIAVPVAAEIFDSMWFNLQYNDTAVVFSHLLSFCDLLGFSTQNTSMPTKRVVFYFQNEKCTINCGRSLHSINTDNKNKGYPPSCMKISTNVSTPNKHGIACVSITPLQLHCFQWLHFIMKTRAWGWSQPLSLPVCAVAQHSIAMRTGGCAQALEVPGRGWVHSQPGVTEHEKIWLVGK